MPQTKNIPLSELCHTLREMTDDPDLVPSYGQLHRACLDGLITTKLSGPRRFIDEATLPAIAALFGFKLRTNRNAA